MCERITQLRNPREFAIDIGWLPPDADRRASVMPFASSPMKHYNSAPGRGVYTMHQLNHALEPEIHTMRWGYRPDWAGKRLDLPRTINANAATVMKKLYYRRLWLGERRCIVPIDGWYEWLRVNGTRRPHYITAANGDPIYVAGITGYLHTCGWTDDCGLVLITLDALGGIVEPQAKRPLVLGRDDAKKWLDPRTPMHWVEPLLLNGLPASEFVSWEVGPDVNNLDKNESELILPLAKRPPPAPGEGR